MSSLNNGFFWDDEEPIEDSGSASSNQDDSPKEKMSSSQLARGPSFFADPDTDNDSALSSYYNEEATFQPSFSQTSAPIFSQLSQSSNLSVAELSRMDESAQESMLSKSSHRDVEMDRQQKKMDRKRKREDMSIIKRKKPKYHLSERQIKRGYIYHKFKYKKTVDVSGEQDVGSSIEYLVRQKLSEPEQQLRLLKIAQEREAQQSENERQEQEENARKGEDITDGGTANLNDKSEAAPKDPGQNAGTTASKSKPNWNFVEEGYVTMPITQAKELPYYIKNISNQKPGHNIEGKSRSKRRMITPWLESDTSDSSADEIEAASMITSRSKGRKRTQMKSDTSLCVGDASVSTSRSKSRSKKVIKWDRISQSFPLHFNQLKVNQKMDLRSFSPMISCGQNGMVIIHGRNARLLLARLVAGGATCNTIQDHNCNRSNNIKTTIKHEGIGSDMSHSESSYKSFGYADIYGGSNYRSQDNGHTTFGSTSIVGAGQDYVTDPTNKEDTNHNPAMRLLSLVHTLPYPTHRNRFYIKIATELGAFRQFWENEFKPLLESPNRDSIISPAELRALKSLFGVDGNISPGPFWCSDPAMATDMNKIFSKMRVVRLNMFPRLRKFIKERVACPPKEVIVPHTGTETLTMEIDNQDNVSTGRSDGVKSGEVLITETLNMDITSDSIKLKVGETSEEGVDSQIDRSDKAASNNDCYVSMAQSLLDIALPNINSSMGNIDKYAKVVHEANMDASNIGLALSLFLTELTAAKADMYHPPEINGCPQIEHDKFGSAKENAGIWNETIDEYLTLAENLLRLTDSNLFKRAVNAPQCASFAQSVMFRQSYASNGSGLGCKSKKKNSQASARLGNVKEEDEEDADESDIDYETDTDILAQKELHSIQLSGKDIIKRGKEHLSNENLKLFTPIHLTTGVAMLTEHIPAFSAEILSRHCFANNPEGSTPFDLAGKALTALDERGELISRPHDTKSRWEARGKVIDDVLVSSWEGAALVFKRCIETDPHAIDHWAWYVTTLLGIACVSSGVSMSKNAGTNDASDQLEDSFDEMRHTGRYELDIYDDKRRHAASAMKDFIEAANKVDCPMFHFAVSSMLGWRHAMLLMDDLSLEDIGDFSQSETKRLYTYHVSFGE